MDPNVQKLLDARRMIDAKLAEIMGIPTDPNVEPSPTFPSGPAYPQTEFSRPAGMRPGMGAARGPDSPPVKYGGLLV